MNEDNVIQASPSFQSQNSYINHEMSIKYIDQIINNHHKINSTNALIQQSKIFSKNYIKPNGIRNFHMKNLNLKVNKHITIENSTLKCPNLYEKNVNHENRKSISLDTSYEEQRNKENRPMQIKALKESTQFYDKLSKKDYNLEQQGINTIKNDKYHLGKEKSSSFEINDSIDDFLSQQNEVRCINISEMEYLTRKKEVIQQEKIFKKRKINLNKFINISNELLSFNDNHDKVKVANTTSYQIVKNYSFSINCLSEEISSNTFSFLLFSIIEKFKFCLLEENKVEKIYESLKKRMNNISNKLMIYNLIKEILFLNDKKPKNIDDSNKNICSSSASTNENNLKNDKNRREESKDEKTNYNKNRIIKQFEINKDEANKMIIRKNSHNFNKFKDIDKQIHFIEKDDSDGDGFVSKERLLNKGNYENISIKEIVNEMNKRKELRKVGSQQNIQSRNILSSNDQNQNRLNYQYKVNNKGYLRNHIYKTKNVIHKQTEEKELKLRNKNIWMSN